MKEKRSAAEPASIQEAKKTKSKEAIKSVKWTLPPPSPLSKMVRHEAGRVCFPVHDVELGPPLQAIPANKALNHLTNGKGRLIAMPEPAVTCVKECYNGGKNVFANMVHTAFYEHYPIVLNPDHVWIIIMQGLAMHVRQNPETLRHHFVQHDGKKEISFEDVALHKDSPSEDWIAGMNGLVDALVPEIGANKVAMFECGFSTTGSMEKYVSRIVLLDTMQHYFKFVMRGGCGIPYVAMEGVSADWEAIRSRVQLLREYDLDWWVDPLTQVLDEFVAASRGVPKREFWLSCCTQLGGSGSESPITGWLSVLYPYVRDYGSQTKAVGSVSSMLGSSWKNPVYTEAYKCNEHLKHWQEQSEVAPNLKHFPSSSSFAPFEFHDLRDNSHTDMLFAGGMLGITQCPETLELRPCLSVAVLAKSNDDNFDDVDE